MKKLLLILAIAMVSCVPDYDPGEPALYDVSINAEYDKWIESPTGQQMGKHYIWHENLFSGTNISYTEMIKMTETYPEGMVTMHEPLETGLLRVTERTITHEITRK